MSGGVALRIKIIAKNKQIEKKKPRTAKPGQSGTAFQVMAVEDGG